MKLDSLRSEIVCYGVIVRVRYHRFVGECKTERNKADVLWEDIERTAEGYRADSGRIQSGQRKDIERTAEGYRADSRRI